MADDTTLGSIMRRVELRCQTELDLTGEQAYRLDQAAYERIEDDEIQAALA